MSHSPIRGSAPGNRLLARLPTADYERLIPHLQPVNLAMSQVLYETRGPIDYAYFPLGAVLSALAVMTDGSAIEVGTVGNEGMVGYSAATRRKVSPNRVIVQIPDGGLRIDADTLRKMASESLPLSNLLADYHAAFQTQISQSVACNGLHKLEQRCCRWLLMTRDRVGYDDMKLTHEYLGIMLGARRASVTDILRQLRDAGLVQSRRGLISVADRQGLEARSCECYRIVRDEYDRLLGKAD